MKKYIVVILVAVATYFIFESQQNTTSVESIRERVVSHENALTKPKVADLSRDNLNHEQNVSVDLTLDSELLSEKIAKLRVKLLPLIEKANLKRASSVEIQQIHSLLQSEVQINSELLRRRQIELDREI